MKPTLFLFLLLANFNLCAQQKEFVYKNFTQEEGLPSNETYYIFEDSKHFLWIATDNGVVRYNGNRFEVFETPDRTVFQIREDAKGRIWFFTYRAQFAYYQNGKMYPYEFNDILKKRITKLHIKDVYIDADENIHLSSAVDSNYVISKEGNITATNHYNSGYGTHDFSIELKPSNTCYTEFSSKPNYEIDLLTNITVNNKGEKKQYHITTKTNSGTQFGSLCPDGKIIYFFYDNIISKLNPDGTSVTQKLQAPVLSLKYHEGILYAGLRNEGLCLVDTGLTKAKQPEYYFRGKSISSVQFDYENGLWVSSLEKGIFYVKNRALKHLITDNEEQPDISYSLGLNDSTLLYGSPKGIYKLTKNKLTPFLAQENAKIIDIKMIPGNRFVCAGSFNGFYTKTSNKKIDEFNGYMLLANPIYYPIIDNHTLISPTTRYVGKYKSAFFSSVNYNATFDSIVDRKVDYLLWQPAKLFKGMNGIIWAAPKDGLYKCVPPYDTLVIENNSDQLNKGIDYIAFLEENILAINAQPGKIVLYDNGIIGTIEEKDGLLSKKIRFMLPVKNQLWVATQLGISVIEFSSYKPLRYTIKNIDKKDGLFNITINHLCEYNGDIVAATSNGLYYIEKSILDPKPQQAIHFYITNINYYKGDIADVSSLTLPYTKNRATIKYRAICYNSFENIQYVYRFTSGDTLWRSTSSNELVLENLEPGKYTLEIKAVLPAQQRASQIQTLNIIVEKPWWQNNWFRLLVALLAGAAIYFIVNSRIRKIQAEERNKTALNAKLTELEQTALRSQMNPHFIFNCLTSIQQLIISGQKTDANEYLVKFSRLIRKTLELSAQPFISIADEKKYLGEYLVLEQLRLNGRFDYTITADQSINMDQTLIPNMMLQPIVENCVRHGIKSLESRKGMITVHFSLAKNAIACSVKDNGTGRNSETGSSEKTILQHRSYGMEIVRKRLETFSEFNEFEGSIEIIDLRDAAGKPEGTEVILYLPFKRLNTV